MKKRIISTLILTMFSASLFVVSYPGDTQEINNENIQSEELTPMLHAGVLKDFNLNIPDQMATKSKTDITISAMPNLNNLNNNDIPNADIVDNINNKEENVTSDKRLENKENNASQEEIKHEDVEKEIIEKVKETNIPEETEVTEDIVNEEVEEIKEETTENICSNRWGITLTEDEIDLLGRLVMLESGGESDLGQQAVIEVIFNRMVDDYFGGSLYDVLSSPGQFTPWKHRNSSRAYPTERVMTNIHRVLNGETNILPFETVYFATSAQNNRIQTQIGIVVFCNK